LLKAIDPAEIGRRIGWSHTGSRQIGTVHIAVFIVIGAADVEQPSSAGHIFISTDIDTCYRERPRLIIDIDIQQGIKPRRCEGRRVTYIQR